jgi:uncharacterized protein YukE
MFKLVYDSELMNSISENYKDCITELENTIDNLKNSKSFFENNYNGQGSDIAKDTFKKIKEHTELLLECCNCASNYIEYSKEEMMKCDKSLMEFFRTNTSPGRKYRLSE